MERVTLVVISVLHPFTVITAVNTYTHTHTHPHIHTQIYTYTHIRIAVIIVVLAFAHTMSTTCRVGAGCPAR